MTHPHNPSGIQPEHRSVSFGRRGGDGGQSELILSGMIEGRGAKRRGAPKRGAKQGLLFGFVVVGLFAGVKSGFGLFGLATPASELKATAIVVLDFDGDGISDLQEEVLGTRVDLADTDGDGSSDLLELARQTDPLDANDVPDASSERVGIAAYEAGSTVTLMTAIYVPAGGLATTNLNFGIAISGQTNPLNTSAILGSSSVAFKAVGSNKDTVYVVDTQVSEDLLQSYSGAAFYATDVRAGMQDSAAVFQVLSLPGTAANGNPMPMLVRPEQAPPGLGPPSGIAGSGSIGAQVAGNATIYRPLSVDEDIPTDWSTGQICYQEMHPVGVNGISVVYEVDSASCESFDTFCSSSGCSAGVGQDIEFVDPGALVGG